MLKTSVKPWRPKADALDRLAAVEASATALVDEDRLDLADIFAASDPTPQREMAGAEMRRSNLGV